MADVVDAEVVDDTSLVKRDNTLGSREMDVIVDDIVNKWNSIISGFENTTISLCMMINETLNKYPKETITEILGKVKTHPSIKKFVSIDRIWQGMRLVKNKPELIQYHLKDVEAKKAVPEAERPYLKKDGEIFWEFYFELEKRPLSGAVKQMMEQEAKTEQWSYRDLRNKLFEYKDEMEHPGAFEERKLQKNESIKSVINVCKALSLENVKKVLDYARNIQMQAFQK